MDALLPLLASGNMTVLVAAGFLAGTRKSTSERSAVADLREEIAELRHQRPAAANDATSRGGD